MATKFYRKKDITYSAFPNAIYPDLCDNNKTSTDIQSGTVSDVTNTGLFLGDFDIPEQPSYGDAELIGAKLGLYINNITSGDAGGTAGLKAFKLGLELGDREGGKSTAGSVSLCGSTTNVCKLSIRVTTTSD